MEEKKPKEVITAYLMSPVDGRWELHYTLAKTKLQKVLEYLKQEKFIFDQSDILTDFQFNYPGGSGFPNILELEDFFKGCSVEKRAKEVERLQEDELLKGHRGKDISFESCFIVRVIGNKNFTGKHNYHLPYLLDCFREMFELGFLVIE